MDQNAGFANCVKRYCPNAIVVYDLFHMVYNFGRLVISSIRIRLANQFLSDKDEAGYKRLKNSRFMLLARKNNLPEEKLLRLNDILNNNKELYEADVLKELLPEIWRSSSKEEASTLWDRWVALAMESTASEIKKFADSQNRSYRDGITNAGIYHFGTNILEGMNNKIKVLKRVAFGYRDFSYFKLRIMNAFRGGNAF